METQSHQTVSVAVSALQAFAERLLICNSVPAAHAEIIASALVAADLRGVDSHGTSRLPSYLARIRVGVLSPTAEPTLTATTPVVAQVDAHNGFGFVAAHVGMAHAVETAKRFGIGMVSVKHSNHFGMSAWVVRQAVEQGVMALVLTNSSPAMPPWGGREKMLGVSPIACGAPGGVPCNKGVDEGVGKDFGRSTGEHVGEHVAKSVGEDLGYSSRDDAMFILDMAPSVAARGKVHKALRRGEPIPEGWALDRDGRPTEDPAAALDGVMLPMGGPKGSALAIMMDVFSGVLSGSAFAGGVTGPYDLSKPADAGHFFVAIKPDLFIGLDDFRARMGELYRRVVGCEPAAGVDRVYFPGELEMLCEETRRRTGVPMTDAEVAALNEEAERVGCEQLVV